MAITFGRPMGIFYSYKEMNIMEKINNKITEFIRSQIEIGATLIFENPAEQYGATSISNVLIRCSDIRDSLLRLYELLKSYAYGDKIHCFPGQETLGYWMGKNRSTINRYLAELRKLGLIDWIQVGLNKPNVYIMNSKLSEAPKKNPLYAEATWGFG